MSDEELERQFNEEVNLVKSEMEGVFQRLVTDFGVDGLAIAQACNELEREWDKVNDAEERALATDLAFKAIAEHYDGRGTE